MFDFLTPEIFNMLVIANLIVGLLLVGVRFYHEMTRPLDEPTGQREQAYDESSTGALAQDDSRS